MVVSTVVVLVRPIAQVDAIFNPKRDLCNNTSGKEPFSPLNRIGKSFDIILLIRQTLSLFDPYIQLPFLVALEKLLYRLSEKDSLGHLKLFGHTV